MKVTPPFDYDIEKLEPDGGGGRVVALFRLSGDNATVPISPGNLARQPGRIS